MQLNHNVERLIKLVDKALQQKFRIRLGLNSSRLVFSVRLWVYFEILLTIGLVQPFSSIAQTPTPENSVITTSIAEIKGWTKEKVSLEPLVEIEGGVTYTETPWTCFFLQEGDH